MRVAIGVLVAVIALVLAGCDDDEDTATEATVPADTTTEAQVPEVVATDVKLSREQVQELRREASEWASLFAVNTCNKYMGQGMCVRLNPVSEAFQKSIAEATVEDIKGKRIVKGDPYGPVYEAAVKYSNGVVVVFNGLALDAPEPPAGSCAGAGGGCDWNIAEPVVNRRFIEAAKTPP